MGTAHYIAPEQALGNDATPSSDVYSLAVVGYECLMGHRPFLSENAVTVAMMHIREIAPPLPPDVPPGVRALVEATLVKDPRRRYADGGEFANAVGAVRAGKPLPAPSSLVVPQHRHQLNVSVPNTGVHQMPAQLPPMGNTFPPGLIPPQAPAPQLPPPATPAPRTNKIVVWVLVAVLAVALLIAVGLAAYSVVNWGQGSVGSGHVTTHHLDPAAALGRTSLRRAPVIGADLAGWPDTVVGGTPHVALLAPTERGETA